MSIQWSSRCISKDAAPKNAEAQETRKFTSSYFVPAKTVMVWGKVCWEGNFRRLSGTLGAARHHRERWDGGGYPSGLAGEETPPPTRLMAVADTYSAMTTDQPYRKDMAPDKTRAILEAGAGSQWDPACVEAFIQAFVSGE